jgi:hypothetical protein
MADRPLPPPLTLALPDCSVCCKPVSTEDDMFCCENCDAWWPMRDAFDSEGEWDDDEKQQCESTDEQGGSIYRCVLSEGHDREHRDSDGRAWAGRPYKVWGYRSPREFTTRSENERGARYMASIMGADYEVVWRMSDDTSYVWVPARDVGAVSANA